jgi:serine/threonine protein kinase
MARLRHPNALLFMGACTKPGNMCVVTEFLAGDVEGLLKRRDAELSVYTRMRMLKEMSQGMNWLHESKPQIIHRDLKPANLLVDANGTVKVRTRVNCNFFS